MTGPAFDPIGLLRALADGGVRFLIIGGVAARIHGSPTLTGDLDVCYDRDPSNVDRLVAALASLHPRLRGTDPDLPFRFDRRTILNGDMFTLMTDVGPLDLRGTPSGTAGYGELAASGITVEIEGLPVQVASLEDLMRMKRAAGRARDRLELEVLGALREELDREQGRGTERA